MKAAAFSTMFPPPGAVAPGDGISDAVSEDDDNPQFDFTQLGVRVPALVISPHVERRVIDHTVYDHTSLLATLEALWGLEPLTNRDRLANNFSHLFSLPIPRRDTPPTLFAPSDSGYRCEDDNEQDSATVHADAASTNSDATRISSVQRGFVHIAFMKNHRLEREALLDEFLGIQTERDALAYVQGVQPRLLRAAMLGKSANDGGTISPALRRSLHQAFLTKYERKSTALRAEFRRVRTADEARAYMSRVRRRLLNRDSPKERSS